MYKVFNGKLSWLKLLILAIVFVALIVGCPLLANNHPYVLTMLQGEKKTVISEMMIMDGETTISYEVGDNVVKTVCKIDNKTIATDTNKPATFTITPDMFHSTYHRMRLITYDSEEQVIARDNYLVKVLNIGDRVLADRAKRVKATYSVSQKPKYKIDKFPILMYHSILPEDEIDNNSAQVGKALFEKQLKGLVEAGYTPISFLQYDQYIKGQAGLPEKPIIITFDDGYDNNYTHAYPILKSQGIQATFFVSSLYVGVDTYENSHFSWEQAKEMEDSGLIDIQSHTVSHQNMSKFNKEELSLEIVSSFEEIEAYLGKRDIKVLCYPEFKNSKLSRTLAQNLDVDLQITNLVSKEEVSEYPTQLRRIHVHNGLSVEELLKQIKELTGY